MTNRTAIAAAIFAATGASSAAAGERMRGFEEIARTTVRADVTGLSGWHKGKFRIDEAGIEGRYEIDSRGESEGAEEARFGGSRFSMTGPDIAGTLSGRCWFDMANHRARGRIGELRVSMRSRAVPLSYRCEFARDGEPIGALEMSEVPSRSLSVKQERTGEIRFEDNRIDLASVHHLGTGTLPTASPVGYTLAAEGRTIGAVDLNGGRKRLALPADPELREAALLSSMALALFWDPGDGDD